MALMARAYNQAQKFGAEMAIPDEVDQPRHARRRRALPPRARRASETVRARTVVIASGARYRRLAVANLAEFEGISRPLLGLAAGGAAVRRPGGRAGRRRQLGRPGGGLSREPGRARSGMLVRGPSLEATMSRYLVDRIAAQPNIEVLTAHRVTALEGSDGMLKAVRWRNRADRRGDRAADRPSVPVHRRRAEHRLAGAIAASRSTPRASCCTGARRRSAMRSRPAARASSPSATCAPARSSGSPPRRRGRAGRRRHPCLSRGRRSVRFTACAAGERGSFESKGNDGARRAVAGYRLRDRHVGGPDTTIEATTIDPLPPMPRADPESSDRRARFVPQRHARPVREPDRRTNC